MKKISSIFLALIIALSLSVVAFADGNPIKPGQTLSLYFEQGDENSYIFEVSTTGIYEFSFEMKNDGYISYEIFNDNYVYPI